MSPQKEIWLLGGNRSGKTECMAVTFVSQLLDLHPTRPLARGKDPWEFYFASQNKDKQREVIQTKLMRYIPKNIIAKKPDGKLKIYSSKDTYEYIEFVDPRLSPDAPKKNLHGAKLWFRTYDSGVIAFESGSIDGAYLDEEPPKSIYEAIQARLLDRTKKGNGWFTCAMTPDADKGMTWTYDDIVDRDGDDPDRIVIHMSTYDNKENLGEKEIQKLEASYDEDTRKARIYGMHVARQGYVLKDFKPVDFPEGNIIDHFKPDWGFFTPYEATDWGYKHPWHWGFYAVSKEGEIIKYDEIHEAAVSPEEMKAKVYKKRQLYGYREPFLCIGDPNMKRKESSGLSVIDKLGIGYDINDPVQPQELVWVGEGPPSENKSDSNYIKFGIGIKLANNDREQGWTNLNARFKFEAGVGRPNWFYTRNCFHSIKEAKNLMWPPTSENAYGVRNRELSRKKNDDAPDADRYLSNDNPVYNEGYSPNIDLPTRSSRNYEDEEFLDAVTGW